MIADQKRFLRRAIRLARRGLKERPSSCEPLVGAVAVLDGAAAGQAHGAAAAIAALKQLGSRSTEASLYVNLEPCCQSEGREACLRELLRLRPRRIIIGALSPAARAELLDRLREAGIELVIGVCQRECRELNEVYFKYAATGLPFVTVKLAQSLDGRIATATGDSKWISGKPALKFAHRLRGEHDAVMVGIGTVLADDPQLNVRLVNGRDPLRIIVDSRLRIPPGAKVLSDGAARGTLIATTELADGERIKELEGIGARVLRLPAEPGSTRVDLGQLLSQLGKMRIGSVLVEGGSQIVTWLLAHRMVDRLVTIIAPKIIGAGLDAIGDLGIRELNKAITLSRLMTWRLGRDIAFDGRLDWGQ
jgi:diaminohydroxyphosphoribosylaminopyrimidine deaminase/5-amino-6-(5-phosphoribosylamino)uracil reductase